MNKRPLILIAALIAATTFLSLTPSVSGSDALRKFSRGVSNIAYGWTDIPLTMHREDELNGPFASLTHGLFRGIYKAASRVAVGVYEVASFPVAWPDGYWPIITPEFPMHRYNDNVLMYE